MTDSEKYIRERLIKQLVVGKIMDIIGDDKAIELLRSATTEIDEYLKK
jgi:hypothetical protein